MLRGHGTWALVVAAAWWLWVPGILGLFGDSGHPSTTVVAAGGALVTGPIVLAVGIPLIRRASVLRTVQSIQGERRFEREWDFAKFAGVLLVAPALAQLAWIWLWFN